MALRSPIDDQETSAIHWQKRLRRLLESEEAEAAVMLLATDEFSTAAKQRLVRIQRHFAKRQSSGISSARAAGRPTGARPPAVSKDVKWSSILNLKGLEDPYFVQEHLDRYEWPEEYSKATAFLWDLPEPALLLDDPLERGATAPDGLNVPITQQSSGWLSRILAPRQIHGTNKVSVIRQNIERRLNFTYHAQRMTHVQQSRELFTMLMWYDFVKCIWPETSGSRIGPQMQKELVPIIKLFFETLDTGKINKFSHDIAIWSQTGRKLHETLCEPFGEAALFVLHGQLSPNFIENRMTLSGGPMTKARAHLKKLGIESLTGRPYLRDLAKDIRKLLSEPFENVTDYWRENMAGLGVGENSDDH